MGQGLWRGTKIVNFVQLNSWMAPNRTCEAKVTSVFLCKKNVEYVFFVFPNLKDRSLRQSRSK